jgi:hypothetical protein
MATPLHILTKVKFLFKLGTSPNPHEAASAKKLAEGLIIKYNITEEELRSIEDKPLYGEDELLFHAFSIVGWMNQLALAIAKHFDCYIVQETLVSALGQTDYNYYVYGGTEEENYVKFVYHTFHKKINYLIDTKCLGRGPIYIDSFAEGCVQGIKENIALEGLDIPIAKVPSRKPVVDQKNINVGASNLVPHKEEKKKPHEESVDVNKQSLIKDVMAYFRGIEEGGRLSLSEILELEIKNEEAEKLSDVPKE